MGKQLEILDSLFEKYHTKELEWNKKCEGCGNPVVVVAILADEGALKVEGGAVFFAPENKQEENKVLVKCDDCFKQNPVFNYQETEVYSRVCGYLRPIKQWNKGKRAELEMRKNYKIKE
jgi:ribosomal protein S27E